MDNQIIKVANPGIEEVRVNKWRDKNEKDCNIRRIRLEHINITLEKVEKTGGFLSRNKLEVADENDSIQAKEILNSKLKLLSNLGGACI